MRELFEGILRPLGAAILAVIVANCNTGCTDAKSPGLQDAYKLEIAACVAKAPTVEASGLCRAAVDRKWGVCDHPEWNLGRCD